MTTTERADYDDGYFWGRTGLPIPFPWQQRCGPQWRHGFSAAITPVLPPYHMMFKATVLNQSRAAVHQATVLYLREPPLGPPETELDPDTDTDRWLLDTMRTNSEPVTPDGSVLAHMINHDDWIEIRAVIAGEPRVPGAVGAWFDSLPRDRRIVVPALVSARLHGILARRGFTQQHWYDYRLGIFDHSTMIRDAG